ncbi:imm11 family protein [Melittangium boletus]
MRAAPALVEGRLRVPVDQPGEPLDFSLADMGAVPVVSEKVATLLVQMAPNDVQLFPVDVDTPGPYFVVNVIRLVKCIDDQASEEVRYWMPEHGRPDRVGTYSSVSGMRIDPKTVGDAKVFRTWGWHIALIIAEDIKDALERAGITGARFTEVTGPSPISPKERERNRRLIELRKQTDAARGPFWRTLGRLDEEAIIPIVVGGAWPARRQVWRIIHRAEGRTLLVTDGLSDFFVDRVEPSVGFGLELALETDEPLKDVEKSWPLLLLERVADEVAEHERVRERLRTGFLSMEVSGKDMPEPLVTREGRVGVLLGMESSELPRGFAMPAGEVRLVTVKVLLPTELAYLLAHGRTGRDELLRRFDQEGQGHLSRIWRSPVA